MLKRYVLPETILLALVCLIDACSTIYLVVNGMAREANPLLAWSFHYGPLAFMVAKVISFVPAITVIEWLRPRLGEFARWSLRLGITAYLILYVSGSLAVHTIH